MAVDLGKLGVGGHDFDFDLFVMGGRSQTLLESNPQAAVASNLVGRGIKLHPLTNIVEIKKAGNGGIRAFSDKKEEFVADAVMFATGRKPNSKSLNLEAACVEVDPNTGAVKVNEHSQTSVPNIWGAGDVTNRIMLTPVVLMEGMALSKTLFGGQPTKPDFKNVPSVVFCQPTLSVVGMSEEQAIAQSTSNIAVYTSSFVPMRNNISGRDEKTLMKLLVDSQTDLVLGVCMWGPDAPEIIRSFAIALKCGVTTTQVDSTVSIHPTAAEALVTMRTPTRIVKRESKL